jgi:hypothetical protein
MRRFSGTHLTIIIVAALVCLALPVTAVGAQIAKVSIADGKGRTVKVKSGRLQVEADVAGTVKTAQQGIVTTQPASPGAYVTQSLGSVTSSCTPVIAAPAGKALVVQQANMNFWQLSSAPSSGTWGALYVGTTGCSTFVGGVNPPSLGVFPLRYEPGVVVPAGSTLFAKGQNTSFDVVVTGYQVAQAAAARAQVRSVGPTRH